MSAVEKFMPLVAEQEEEGIAVPVFTDAGINVCPRRVTWTVVDR